jgi:hypothetical protein
MSVARVKLGKYSVGLPENRPLRIGIGVLLILGGTVGFLPVVGFWMVPAGFLVLATDSPPIRRFNRRVLTNGLRWWRGQKKRPRSGAV